MWLLLRGMDLLCAPANLLHAFALYLLLLVLHFFVCLFFLFFNFYFYFILLYNTVLVLPYIDMNPPQVYKRSQTWTPLPLPSPLHLYGSSLCTSPKHAVSWIGHRLTIRFLHDNIHVSIPFSQIIPPSPSPYESKSPLYTSVSPLLSCIQGHHCHLLKDDAGCISRFGF